MCPDDQSFAEAVAKWQDSMGFRGNDVDGIIGPNTWKKMRSKLKLTECPTAKARSCVSPIISKDDPTTPIFKDVGTDEFNTLPVLFDETLPVLEKSYRVKGNVFYPGQKLNGGLYRFDTSIRKAPIVFIAHGQYPTLYNPKNRFDECRDSQERLPEFFAYPWLQGLSVFPEATCPNGNYFRLSGLQ